MLTKFGMNSPQSGECSGIVSYDVSFFGQFLLDAMRIWKTVRHESIYIHVDVKMECRGNNAAAGVFPDY